MTGAGSGVGLHVGIGLVREGARLVAICRNARRAAETADHIRLQTGSNNVMAYAADLSVQREVKAVGEEIRNYFGRVDVLINDAGCVASEFELTSDGIERVLAVNHLAPFLLTHCLLPAIKKSPEGRIINVSSRAHSRGTMHFDDLFLRKNFSLTRSYDQSKLCNMLFTYYLADKLKASGITVNVFHPALVNTPFGAKGVSTFHKWIWQTVSKLGRSASDAAEDGVYLALSNEVAGITGKYFHNKKQIKSSVGSHNSEWQQKLWDISLQLTKLRADEYGEIS